MFSRYLGSIFVVILKRLNLSKGHALAFGCVLAMSCDYRVMIDSDRSKIGLNAALLVHVIIVILL